MASITTHSTPIHGEVRDRTDGKPISGAVVTLEISGGAKLFATTSDARGDFTMPAAAAGRYRLEASARGYATLSSAITLSGKDRSLFTIVLSRAGTLRSIGGVAVHAGDRASVQSDTILSQEELSSPGALRVADSLGKLSGVDLTGDAGATGGDEYVSIRGLRPGESQTFLDGHPIGPIGIQSNAPDSDGTIAGFNFQDAPFFALRDVDVIFGAGASGLTSTDAVAGTLDLRTLDPSQVDQVAFQQGIGTQGRAFTSLSATGTEGKLGYALVHGVEGTYGEFPGGQVAQTGLRGTDFTSQTLGRMTYNVSGDYVLRNELAKLVYSVSPNTKVAFAAYDATSWSDKTGEGDNDFNPFAYVLANAPVGVSPACPHGVLVTTNAGSQCLSPGAYAAGASGPAGGGPGAWQALRNQDYDGRVTSMAGAGAIVFDIFSDQYDELYNRDASAASGAYNAFLDRWSTQGLTLSDELTGSKNTFGFGLGWLRQSLSGDATTPDASTLVQTSPAMRIDQSAFVRDVFAPDSHLSFFFNAWLKKATGDPTARFDPRLSLEYKPLQGDAFRVTAGSLSDEPGLEANRVNLLPVGALNPNCGAIAKGTPQTPAAVDVGSGPATNLAAESAEDLEFGYDHRFLGGSNVGLNIYDMNVTNRIVTGEFAAGSLLPAAVVPGLLNRIDQFCGVSPAPGAVAFTLNRSFNAATARLRGFELVGRERVSAQLAVDYAYNVQSVVLNDLPANVLETDATLVNGLQVFGVPVHKATLGLEGETRSGLSIDLDGHAVGPNNPQQLPGYAYADFSLAQSLPRNVTLALSVGNVFNSHTQAYGLVGYGLQYATNSYNSSLNSPYVQPFNERYGLPPRALSISATLRR